MKMECLKKAKEGLRGPAASVLVQQEIAETAMMLIGDALLSDDLETAAKLEGIAAAAAKSVRNATLLRQVNDCSRDLRALQKRFGGLARA